MKKVSAMLAILMVAGAASGWCVIEPVDSTIDNHTKNHSLRPVQDAGQLYGVIDDGIHTSLDKVPVIKERSVIIHPIEKLVRETLDASKMLVNGTWDLLTFKKMRDKK